VRVAIFGGTGPTGRLAIEAALVAGHTVTVLARDPASLARRARLTIATGRLDDAAAVDRVIAEADAVLSLLGPKPGGDTRTVPDGAAAILAAMSTHGVHRLVAVSHAVAGDPADRIGLVGRTRLRLAYVSRPTAYREIVRTAERIRASSADWTLLRASRLTDGPRTGRVIAGPLTGSAPAPISRANLADILVRELADGALVGQAPVVSDG
jgi:putative NADH-flavin reductase